MWVAVVNMSTWFLSFEKKKKKNFLHNFLISLNIGPYGSENVKTLLVVQFESYIYTSTMPENSLV